jgi:hypothetical protein
VGGIDGLRGHFLVKKEAEAKHGLIKELQLQGSESTVSGNNRRHDAMNFIFWKLFLANTQPRYPQFEDSSDAAATDVVAWHSMAAATQQHCGPCVRDGRQFAKDHT